MFTNTNTYNHGHDLNWQDAEFFLHLLKPQHSTDLLTFQIYPNAKGSHALRLFGKTLADAHREIQRYNATGSGIGVIPHECVEDASPSGNGVRQIWSLCLDDDGEALPVGKLPLAPSLTVETSPNRFQHHWLIRDEWIAIGEGKADFDAAMRSIVDIYGGDPAFKNIKQPVRLPGTWNNKYETPFLARLLPVPVGGPVRYSRAEILAVFVGDNPRPTKDSIPDIESFGWNDEPVDLRRVESALQSIPADGRSEWLTVGMALHHDTDASEDAFQVWDAWSQTTTDPKKYDARRTRYEWDTFKHEHANPKTLASVYALAMEHGWVDNGEAFANADIVPTARPIMSGRLARATIDSLQEFSQANEGFRPSPAQWQGLGDLVSALEALANGKAEPLVFLSSLDPGLGKTQSVIRFTKELLKSPDHGKVAVLICVGRLDEIRSYVDNAELADDDYAVLVADDPKNQNLNQLGNAERSRARVLFITQQMLEARAKRHGSFAAIPEFWFEGRPRQVRIWDEACLPARPLAVEVSLIEGMTNGVKSRSSKLHAALKSMINAIDAAGDGAFVDVPELETTGIDVAAALAMLREEKTAIQSAIRDLYLLSGKTVAVVKHGNNSTFVHYENTLPDDLKPYVVCDASGRVRQTYPHWATGRGDLVELQRAEKDYCNLTTHLWATAGSKSAWRDNADELIKGLVATVDAEPDRRFLIVHHMQNNKTMPVDIPTEIKRRSLNPDRLEFVHWGSEDCRATNRFRDIDRVILAGTLFMDESYYEAIGRLSRGLRSDQNLERAHRRQIKLGEHADLILQAVCRGSVRKLVDGKCGHCHVYIIAAAKSGIGDMLRDGKIFPGAKVLSWEPIAVLTQPTESMKLAIDYVADYFRFQPDGALPVPELRERLGVKDKDNFNKRVINTKEFTAFLTTLGLALTNGKGRSGRRIAPISDAIFADFIVEEYSF